MKTTKYLLPIAIVLAISTTFSSCKTESSDKQIISFAFNDLNPPVDGSISQNIIEATVPASTDVTTLSPTINISDKASVNPPSGNPQNFTNPVQYTVTAEDGSIAGYTVKIQIEGEISHVDINWSKLAESPTKRGWMPAAALGDKMYVIGGIVEGESEATNTMEVYDPATDTWDTTKGKLVYRRYDHTANVVNGKIYVMGGIMGGLVGPAINSVEAYDPQTDEWQVVASMPQDRAAHAACVIDGKIYVIGGETAEPTQNDNLLDDVDVYDPVNDSWESKAPLPVPMAYLSASAVNGKIYVVGGTNHSPWEGLTTVYEYDPQTNIWTKMNDIKYGRWALSSCAVNDMIFCIAGSGGGISTGISTVEVYSPSTNKSYSSTGLLAKSYALGACVYHEKIYVFSGCNSAYPYANYTNVAAVGVPVWE